METNPIVKKDYNDYLDRYFELKQKYDAKLNKQKKQKGAFPLCVQCGKKGGTFFSNKNNRYTAVCKATPPCKLHIELYRGFFSNSTNLLYQYLALLEESKENIIRIQNNEMFHYSQNELKKKYENEKTHFETVTQLFSDLKKCLYENEELKEKTKETIAKINQNIIEIRSNIADYTQSEDMKFIENAMQQQKNVLLPLLDELQHLRFEIIEADVSKVSLTKTYLREGVEIVEKRDSMMSVLVEREVALHKEEINVKEPPAVVHWVL